MNNEKMNQMIDESWANYKIKTLDKFMYDTTIAKYTITSKEEFINKCKTDTEFSQKWGLRIEERALSLEERYKIWFKNNFETGMEYNENNLPDFENDYYESTPTRLITITYNNEIIEIYES